jgi:regulator of sigma E protease
MVVLLGLLVLSIVIIIHELGHFLAARAVGVRVYEFAVGFGKKLLSFQAGQTEFSLRLVPLGGFVALAGLDEGEEVAPEENFKNKSYLARLFIILAGPLFNFISAGFFLFLSLWIYGLAIPSERPVVGQVMRGSPAEDAGFKKGDIVLFVDGVQINVFADIAKAVQESTKDEVEFKIKRGLEELTLVVKPRELKEAEKKVLGGGINKLIGIRVEENFQPVGLVESIKLAIFKTLEVSTLIVKLVKDLLSGEASKEDLAGPVYIVSEAGQSAKEGFKSVLSFLFIISVNLALINLFPIPLLDGGHIVVLSIESLLRRELPFFLKNALNILGFVILVGLMLLALKNDIVRLIY